MRPPPWMALLAALAMAPGQASAETVELVTYYPAPPSGGGGGGVPDNLQVRSLTVGDAYKTVDMTGMNQDGAVYIMSRLGIGTPATAGRLDVVGAPDALDRAVFVPGGGLGANIRLGIGTPAPAALVHIAGSNDAQENVIVMPGTNTPAGVPARILVGLGTAGPQGVLHVTGENDVQDQAMFLPGADTAAAGVPVMQVGIGTAPGNIGGPILLHMRQDQPIATRVLVQNASNAGWAHSQFCVENNSGGPGLGFLGYLGAMSTAFPMVQYRDKCVLSSRLGRDLVLSAEEMNSNILFYTQVTAATPNNPAVEKMRLTNAGDVGIGTTAPAGRLHVMGPANAQGNVYFMPGPDTPAAGYAMMTVAINALPPYQAVLEVMGGMRVLYSLFIGTYPVLRFRDTDSPNNNRNFQAQQVSNRWHFGSNMDAPSEWGWRYPDIMVLQHLGRMAFGGAQSAQTLRVHGPAAKTGGGNWANSSDARLKTNVRTIPDALQKIASLRGVEFEWVNRRQHEKDPGAGFVGQELERIFPDWVEDVEADGPDARLVNGGKMKTMYLPTAFNAYVVEAIKELKTDNERLEEGIGSLRKRLHQERPAA